jgi:hypothetical protein
MFAWYIRRIKNSKGGVVYRVCYVLHYRLENRPPPSTASTPESTALAPESTALAPESTASAPESTALAPKPVRQPTPVTLHHNDEKLYPCEWCSYATRQKCKVLTSSCDIYTDDDDNKPCYVSMCNKKCCWDYQKWCMGLVPGLNSRPKGDPINLIRVTFNGIFVPYEGDALHDEWCVQFFLIRKGRRTGMIITPYDDKTVYWGQEFLTPGIHVSLNKLRKWFPYHPTN